MGCENGKLFLAEPLTWVFVGWVEPVPGAMGFAIAQPILRKECLDTVCEGAKPITPVNRITKSNVEGRGKEGARSRELGVGWVE